MKTNRILATIFSLAVSQAAFALNTVCMDESKSALRITLEGIDFRQNVTANSIPVSIELIASNQFIGRSDQLNVIKDENQKLYFLSGYIDDLQMNQRRYVGLIINPYSKNGKHLEITTTLRYKYGQPYFPYFLNCEVVK